MVLPTSWLTDVIGELFGTSSAALLYAVLSAPTITSLEVGSANTGGASPTPPMSSAPEEIACRIGGPEVKSAHFTCRPSLRTPEELIRPAAVSTASAPVPAWSPTLRTVPFSFVAGATTLADGVVADFTFAR